MREIIQIACGQAGNDIGGKFLDHILDDTGIHPKEQPREDIEPVWAEKIRVFFRETERGFSPRFIFSDLSTGALDSLKEHYPWQRLEPTDVDIVRPEAAEEALGFHQSNYANAYFSLAPDYTEAVMEHVRRHAEACDSLQGFLMFHGLGGGTGGGVGAMLSANLRDEYPDSVLTSMNTMPSPRVSDIVVEPYNYAFALEELDAYLDLSVTIDNGALASVIARRCRNNQPTFGDLNYLAMSGFDTVAAHWRFADTLNGDMRKMARNMVPLPFAKIVVPSFAPVSRGDFRMHVPSVADIINHSVENHLMGAPLSSGKTLACSMMIRYIIPRVTLDNVRSPYHVENALPGAANFLDANSCRIFESRAPRRQGVIMSGGTLINSSSVGHRLKEVLVDFEKMARRRAFWHWYEPYGMEESDFASAYETLANLVENYAGLEEGRPAELAE